MREQSSQLICIPDFKYHFEKNTEFACTFVIIIIIFQSVDNWKVYVDPSYCLHT